MLKKMYSKAAVLLMAMMLVLAACSGENNVEVTNSSTPAPITDVEVEEEEVVEEVSEPVSYLQQALEQLKNVETLSYAASVGDSFYMYNVESNTLATATDYVFNMNGELRRSPASAYIAENFYTNFQSFDANNQLTESNEQSTDSEVYIVGGDSAYFNTTGYAEWYKVHVSDSFNPLGTLENFVETLLLYPDQLVILDAFDEGPNPDAATIGYELTPEQFVEHNLTFRQSFFAGHYDVSDVELTSPNVDTVNGITITISIDRDFNLIDFYLSYSDNIAFDENASPEDYSYYFLSLYFNSPNGGFTRDVPAEIVEQALEQEGE